MARAGLRVTATDAVAKMVDLIPEHPLITPLHATFDDISGTDLYDAIWANFSLLHAPRADMPRHLADCIPPSNRAGCSTSRSRRVTIPNATAWAANILTILRRPFGMS